MRSEIPVAFFQDIAKLTLIAKRQLSAEIYGSLIITSKCLPAAVLVRHAQYVCVCQIVRQVAESSDVDLLRGQHRRYRDRDNSIIR